VPVRRRVVVSGRVQGVFFRDSCRARAQKAGLSGWVRNVDDGTVEACFEGDAEAVDELVAWCRSGPDSAHVRDVDVIDEEPRGEEGFGVR
jgi:acylphosphatase